MGLFDQYLPYGNMDENPDDQSFSLGLNDAIDLPDFDAESYAAYQNKPSRADSYKSKLQETMGKFDNDGRFGIDDQDKAFAKDQKWSQLGKRLAKAGFSHSYQGYGDAMQDLGGAMGGAESAALDSASNKNLLVELAKLDMEKNLSQAEKDRIALEIAQNDFDDKQKARVMGAQIFKAEMPPEKIELLVSSIKNPADRAIAKQKFALAQLYMEAGDHEKAMKEMEDANSLIPQTIQDRVDKLFAAEKAKAEGAAEGQAEGKISAQLEAAQQLPNGFRLGSGGNVESEDPLEARAKQAQIDAAYAGIADRKIDNDRLARQDEKQTATELRYEQGLKKGLFKALSDMASIKARGYQYKDGKLWSIAENRFMDRPEDSFGEKGKTLEQLLALGGNAIGQLSQYPQLGDYMKRYGNPTTAINTMMEDEKQNRYMPVAPPSTSRTGGRFRVDTRPKN